MKKQREEYAKIVNVLRGHESPLTMGEIAKEANVRPEIVTKILDWFHESGALARASRPGDGVWCYFLMPDARKEE